MAKRTRKKVKLPAKFALSEQERDAILDVAVGRVRVAVGLHRGVCLLMSVLLARVLAKMLPSDAFAVRLGSLHVLSLENARQGITFDPRHPDGIDAGFHAWVEDRRGELVDPSITLTLAAEGYDVDDEALIQSGGRGFDAFGLRFVYDELPELEILNLEACAEFLASLEQHALGGAGPRIRPPAAPLDVGWRRRE